MSVTKKKKTAAVKKVKPSRPKQNDKEDVRCAYVKDRPDIDFRSNSEAEGKKGK